MVTSNSSVPYQGQSLGQYQRPQYQQAPQQQQPIATRKRRTFNEFMSEQRAINRWFVLMIAIFGAFCGALLALAFMLFGLGMKFK